MDGACWVCFCCWHSPIEDMNIRIFGVLAMECMCAQTRPRFILSSERVLREWSSEPMLTPREKSPLWEKFSEEDRTHNAASGRAASPTLPTSYSGPSQVWSVRSYSVLYCSLCPLPEQYFSPLLNDCLSDASLHLSVSVYISVAYVS